MRDEMLARALPIPVLKLTRSANLSQHARNGILSLSNIIEETLRGKCRMALLIA
ncbi:MAG: hypothetical protein ABR985_04140 [Methanotrichaceae archaeon]